MPGARLEYSDSPEGQEAGKLCSKPEKRWGESAVSQKLGSLVADLKKEIEERAEEEVRMKKSVIVILLKSKMRKLITLLAVVGMVLALAPAAPADIVATGEIADWTYLTDGDGNWTNVTAGAGSSRPAGTLVIDDTGTANLVNSDSQDIYLGGAGGGTMTVSGSGAEFRIGSGKTFGVGQSGSGELTVTNGGLVNVGFRLYLGHSGAGYALVTGAGSTLTSPLIAIGYASGQDPDTHILTIADGGLVQADSLKFSVDESGADVGGYVHMDVGGVLAVLGDKTALSQAALFASGGLFTKFNAANVGEIQYHNGTTWVDMIDAPASAYTLTYETTGDYVGGYTVLTMLLPGFPFIETFEDSPAGMASNVAAFWAGQHLWDADASGTNYTAVQTNVAYGTSAKAGSMTNAVISRAITNSTATNVWVDFYGLMPRREVADPVTNNIEGSAVFYVNTDGNVVALSNSTWVTCSSYTVPTGQWVRLLINLDYSVSNWSVYAADNAANTLATNLFSNLVFNASSTNTTVTKWLANAQGDLRIGYLDNLTIADEAVSGIPFCIDRDGDGLPDAWETTYIGSIATSDGTGNIDGDDYTDYEEFIAGTHPTNGSSYLRILSADLASEGSDNIEIAIAGGDTKATTIYAGDEARDRRFILVAATDDSEATKAIVVNTQDDRSGTPILIDTNAAALHSSRFYLAAASFLGGAVTNTTTEWSMFTQERQRDYAYMVAVPVELGASNNLNSTLGEQLARGLPTNTWNKLDYLEPDGTNWALFHYTNVAGTAKWLAEGGGDADLAVTNGMGFRLRIGPGGDAVRTNCVFVGLSNTSTPVLNITTNGAGATGWAWSILPWSNRKKLTYSGGSNEFVFADVGYGGSQGHPMQPHALKGDQIWIWERNGFRRYYWLISSTNAARDGRWWSDSDGAFGNFSFEPGKAYYYRHHVDMTGGVTGTNFQWVAPTP